MNQKSKIRSFQPVSRSDCRTTLRRTGGQFAGRAVLLLAATAMAGAVLVAPSVAHANLLAYEGFNYSTGSGSLTGQDGGFGWDGAWETVVTGSSSVQAGSLVAGANSPQGYDAHSVGNFAFTPNGTRTGRWLDTSTGGIFGTEGYLDASGNIGAAGKTLYLSFIQEPNVANNNFYEFEFHRGNLNDPGRIAGVGCDTAGSTSVYLRTPSAAQTLIGPASTTASLYVVRIDFQGGNDTVTVYQNPTSATEPATPTLVVTGAGDMSFNGISFGAFVNGVTVAHDEVRLGETWSDVISPTATSTGKWVGGGTDHNWSTGGNWDNGVVPVFANSLTFSGNAGLTNTNNLTGISANNVTFDASAGAFTLAGNSLGLNGNLTFSGNPAVPITQTIDLPLAPSADFTVDLPTNGSLLINGPISAANSTLYKLHNGTLTLAGTNLLAGVNLDGGTTVSDTNIITGNTTVTGTGSTTFYLANGDYLSARDWVTTLIIQPGATLTVNGTFGDSGVIGRDGGSGTVIQNGGTFSFNPGNNGSLFVGATSASGTQAKYILNAGVFDLNGNTLAVALGDSGVVFTGAVSQVGGVITNVGTLDLGAVRTYGHGVYNLSGGTIYVGAGGITSDDGSYAVNLGGGTISAQTGWSSSLNLTLTGSNGPVTFNPAGNTIVLSGVLAGSGGLSVTGGGTLELSGANTYTGDSTVSAGILQLDTTGSSSGAYRLTNGGTLNLNFTGSYVAGNFYTNGVALPIGTYNAANLPNFLTGTGNLQVTSGISTGHWTGLGANNDWSTANNWDNNAVPIFPHAVTFAGSTRLDNTNDLDGLTISSLTFDSAAGAFTLAGNDITLNGTIAFNGTPAAPVTQTVDFGMTFIGNQTIRLPTNGNLTLGGSLSTSFGVTQSGEGTLTLGGANDALTALSVEGGTNVITGNVTVSGSGSSRFYLGDGDTLADCIGTLIIQTDAVLNVSGSFGDSGVIGRDSGSGAIIQNGGTFNFDPDNINYLFVGASSSAATRAEYHMNGGTLNLNGYTLGVALSANSATLITGLVSQVSGTINNVGNLDLGSFTFGPGHGIYSLSGGSIYIGGSGITSDSGSYEVRLGGGIVGAVASWSSPLNMTLTGSNGPVTFDTAGNTITLSGILSGAGGLTVIGGGTLELSGANSYGGDTVVSAGTLQLDATGSSSGAFRLATGTLLDLNFSGTYVVSSLYTNGVGLPLGVYNSGNLTAWITGGGNVQVVGGVSTGRWTGQGANRNWSTAGNWNNDAVPIFPIDLTFAGSAGLNNSNDLSGVSANSLTFDAAAGAFTIGGNGLGLNGNLGFSGNPATPILQTINLALTPAANLNVDTPANGNLLINGDLTAANNTLYKVDNGTLTLSGNDTLAGFDVDGGTNVITGNTTITGTGSTRAYVANGDYVGNCVGALVIANGATFTINGSFGDAYVIGRDGGRGRVIQNGGTFNFNPGNQSYLFIGAANNSNTRAEYDLNGGLLDLNGKTLGMALGVNTLITGVVNQVSGVITNLGNLSLDTSFSTGYSIYNLTGGSLYLGAGGITVFSGGSYELNLGGGTIGAEANWASSLNLNLTGNHGSVTFNPAGYTITLSGVLSGAGGLNVGGGGTLELSGANTYIGDTTVAAGSTLQLDAAEPIPGAVRLAAGAVLDLNYIGTATVGSLSTNGTALSAGSYNASTLPGFLAGTGSVEVVGSLPTTPTNLTFSVSTGHLSLSWPANYEGWILQMQTNALNVGLNTNWVDVAGSAGITSTNIPIDPTKPAAFYRLRYPTP